MGTSARSDSDGSLLDAAGGLIAAAAADLRPDAAPVLDELRATLGRELRIAVAGRVSAGKSTLVNALLGRRVAPTAAGECTRVVTWYRYGSPDRADLVLKDGSTRSLPMGDGLPERLGVPADSVARIEVRLQSAPLRRYALVDTPGLGASGVRTTSPLARPSTATVTREAPTPSCSCSATSRSSTTWSS
jgi:GTPase SAR1 family protein